MSHSLQEQQQLTWAATWESFTIATSLLFSGTLCLQDWGCSGKESQGSMISSNALQTYQLAPPVSGLTADHAVAV